MTLAIAAESLESSDVFYWFRARVKSCLFVMTVETRHKIPPEENMNSLISSSNTDANHNQTDYMSVCYKQSEKHPLFLVVKRYIKHEKGSVCEVQYSACCKDDLG